MTRSSPTIAGRTGPIAMDVGPRGDLMSAFARRNSMTVAEARQVLSLFAEKQYAPSRKSGTWRRLRVRSGI
jgi:hypothetical protein